MKKFLTSLVAVALIAPQIVLASWWNPATWNIWNIFKRSIKQTEVTNSNNRNVAITDTSATSEIEKLKKRNRGA